MKSTLKSLVSINKERRFMSKQKEGKKIKEKRNKKSGK